MLPFTNRPLLSVADTVPPREGGSDVLEQPYTVGGGGGVTPFLDGGVPPPGPPSSPSNV